MPGISQYMFTGRRRAAADAAKTTYYHSAIGTHRLQPRPLKNILYPFYRHYKPVYRARNSRTPLYYWPQIDKYPWHSHQKRFPRPENIGISLFSEFARRNPAIRTLFETLHPLPLHGVNCLFWKTERKNNAEKTQSSHEGPKEQATSPKASSEPGAHKKFLNVKGTYYVVDKCVRNDACYLIKHVDFKLRPFKAKVVADLYMDGRLMRENVTPIGAIRGEWRWSLPYTIRPGLKVDTISMDALCVQDSTLYRGKFAEIGEP